MIMNYNSKPILLCVDDEASLREVFHGIFKDEYEVALAADGEEALEKFRSLDVNVVLLDITLPKTHGFEVLRKIKEMDESVEVIVVTASDEIEVAIEAMKLGAFHYMVKPFRTEELRLYVRKALDKRNIASELRQFQAGEEKQINIIGKSKAMQSVFDTMMKISNQNTIVLLYGETGTGKELIAKSMHIESSRRNKPFIKVDCVTLCENLIESELFGHEKGAFTGAIGRKMGKIEAAHSFLMRSAT